jgi:outer membrane protein assembly factor BamB
VWKRRYTFEALIIVAVVAVALVILTRLPPHVRARIATKPDLAETNGPWSPSAEFDAQANADFAVETARTDNVPTVGKHVGADWPLFAGSHRDNRSLETGLLPRWPAEGPPLKWISRGLGAGYSGVAVVDGIVYTMGNKGSSEAIMAIDAGTGKKIWATPNAWASHPSQGDGPRSTPAVSHNKVYTLGARGDLACLDAGTGRVCWQRNLVEEFGSQILYYGFSESVLVDEDRVLCTPGGIGATLAAFHAQTGELVWKSILPQHDHVAYASPIVVETGGVRQYVQFTAEGTVGVRADDGQFLWRDDSASNPQVNCSSPLAMGNFVFTSSDYGGGGSLVKLVANKSKISAELVYHTRDMSSHHGGMVAVDGLLYGSSGPGVLTCLDLATGKVKWKNRSVGKGSVTYADGRIYLRSEQGAVALVEATGAGYHELGRFEQPQRSKSSAWPYPVVAQGKLFLRDQDLLLCYDLRPTK